MGNIQATLKAAFPPASQYTHEDIPDQTGKTILVTGGKRHISKSNHAHLAQGTLVSAMKHVVCS